MGMDGAASSYGTHNAINETGESSGRFDVTQFFRDTFRTFIGNWWLIIALALGFSALLCFNTKRSFHPIYKAKATFTVDVIGISGMSSTYYSQETADQLSKTFPSILTSGILNSLICEDLGVKALPASINAYVEGSTALFTMETTAADPDSAYKVLKSAIKVYPDVARFVVGNTELNLINEPQLPNVPINSIQYVSSIEKGCIAAIALCLLLAMLLAATRKTIRSTNDLKTIFSLRCIGSIPYERSAKHGRRREFTSIENEKASKNFVDSIRLIRTRIEKSTGERGEKVILIASSVPREGKTTVSVNIALSLAEKGKRVILVDCDIRKPSSIGNYTGLCDKGLVDYLLGEAQLPEVIGKKGESLDIINGIRNSNNAAELLKTARMNTLVLELRKRYDYVILDSPPCAIMADAQALSEVADSAIYVVCHESTRKSQKIDPMSNLSNTNVRFIGYVMNNASSAGMGTGYGKYGYNKYGKYGYGKYAYSRYAHYGEYTKIKSE